MHSGGEQNFSQNQPQGSPGQPGAARSKRNSDPLIGTVLMGEYQIIDLLGEGGMAKVYKAMQTSVQRYVAIKTLTTSAPDTVARFANEVKLLSKLKQDNIVKALDCLVDPDNGQVYFVMEYLAGMTLEDLIKTVQRLSTEDDIASVIGQLCDALSHAHNLGIIHRDLKPANVILREQDGEIIVKLFDFGIARVEDETQRLTRAGVVVGSPLYMSPEQCMGNDLDARSDLYSLGALMYELITGELPYLEQHVMKLMSAHCDPLRIPDPIETKVKLKNSNQLDQIIRTAMDTEPENRFQTAEQFKEALHFWWRAQKEGKPDTAIPVNLQSTTPAPKKGITTTQSHTLQELVAKQQEARDPSTKVWRSPELFTSKSEHDRRRTVAGAQFEQLRQNESLVDRTIFKKYKVLNLIGEGGMAVVYRAQNVETGEMVAIKTLKFFETDLGARFAREVAIHEQLKHPNIVKSIECLETPDGQAFFVMELLTGIVLDDQISTHGPVSDVEDMCTILGQILDAIEFAHDKGVIHRDIKLENIILTEQKGQIRVKVLDFGVARIQEDLQRLTKTGVVLGSPAYMSPEQCMGKALDSRSDLYSLGVVAYELITGALPISGETEIEMMDRHCDPSVVAAPLSKYRNDLPNIDELHAVMAKCLAKNPDLRYQSIIELKTDLNKWWQSYPKTSDSSTPFRVSKRKQELSKRAAQETPATKESKQDLSKELAGLVSEKRETEREAFASRYKDGKLPGADMRGMVKPLLISVSVLAALVMFYFASTAVQQVAKQNQTTHPDTTVEAQPQTRPSGDATDTSLKSKEENPGQEISSENEEEEEEETPAPRRKKHTGYRVLAPGQYSEH